MDWFPYDWDLHLERVDKIVWDNFYDRDPHFERADKIT